MSTNKDAIEKVLNTAMQENDGGAKTVGEYLEKLLLGVWLSRESFNGKRPYGKSGWEYEIYATLVVNDLVDGSIDEFGGLLDFDIRDADKLITRCIEHVFSSYKQLKEE